MSRDADCAGVMHINTVCIVRVCLHVHADLYIVQRLKHSYYMLMYAVSMYASTLLFFCLFVLFVWFGA